MTEKYLRAGFADRMRTAPIELNHIWFPCPWAWRQDRTARPIRLTHDRDFLFTRFETTHPHNLIKPTPGCIEEHMRKVTGRSRKPAPSSHAARERRQTVRQRPRLRKRHFPATAEIAQHQRRPTHSFFSHRRKIGADLLTQIGRIFHGKKGKPSIHRRRIGRRRYPPTNSTPSNIISLQPNRPRTRKRTKRAEHNPFTISRNTKIPHPQLDRVISLIRRADHLIRAAFRQHPRPSRTREHSPTQPRKPYTTRHHTQTTYYTQTTNTTDPPPQQHPQPPLPITIKKS